jgi:hypothetical protein
LTSCSSCGEVVDPGETGVTHAVKQIRLRAMGGDHYADGLGAYVHPGCFPEGDNCSRVVPPS